MTLIHFVLKSIEKKRKNKKKKTKIVIAFDLLISIIMNYLASLFTIVYSN